MMGSRGWKGGDECDALSMRARRLVSLSPKTIRRAKRSFWKRDRKAAKNEARQTAGEAR
jgi:hypothetical protein